MLTARYDGRGDSGACERGGDKAADCACPQNRYPHEENFEATGRFELPDGAFAEPCLTTWLRRRVRETSQDGAGSGNRTHASTLGRSQATITSYPRAPGHPGSVGARGRPIQAIMFTERARISAIVTSEIEAWMSMSIFAIRESGMTSVGLNAVAFVNAR